MRAETLGAIFEGEKNPDNGALPSRVSRVTATQCRVSVGLTQKVLGAAQEHATCTGDPSTPQCDIWGSSWQP